jgi:predicted HicB family RNase H-like nuclease
MADQQFHSFAPQHHESSQVAEWETSSSATHTTQPRFNGEQGCDPYQLAQQLYSRPVDWVTFYREILGVNGIIRQTYSHPEALARFEASPQYAEIQHMLAKLRENSTTKDGSGTEPTRVITVRLPKSLHEALRTEAHEKRTSMNKLCISKLLQVIDRELVPTE